MQAGRGARKALSPLMDGCLPSSGSHLGGGGAQAAVSHPFKAEEMTDLCVIPLAQREETSPSPASVYRSMPDGVEALEGVGDGQQHSLLLQPLCVKDDVEPL